MSGSGRKGEREFLQFQMEYIGDVPSVCPSCGGRMYKHGERPLTVTDTTVLGKPVKLLLQIPRRRCQSCKAMWSPSVPEINEKHMLTNRLYQKMTADAMGTSFEQLADEYALSPGTVKNSFVDFLKEKESSLRFMTPAFLGIDEIKIKKLGEITVITDLEHHTLYDMIRGRTKDVLEDYFARFPEPEKVIWVCSDMYRPFEGSMKALLPNARFVIDHFHVVGYANRAMDSVRLTVQSKLAKKDRIKTKKGLAYTLRTRLKDLTSAEAQKIKMCREKDEYRPIAIAFDLKEDFFNIYDEHRESKDGAIKAYESWCNSIPDDPMYDGFRDLKNMVENFKTQIFNFWDCPIQITNGFTECTNRIIRENNVKGRGSSFEILRGRSLYRRSNIENLVKNGMLNGPLIPSSGSVFYFEETKGFSDDICENERDSFDSFDYSPFIGLIPGRDYDPETGEIFDILDGENEVTED